MSAVMKFVPRRSEERENADRGWLKTFHTFSVAAYPGHEYQGFGPLRIINEDRVEAQTGFGTHSHSEFEIFSYVVSGELEHKDSMGNVEILKRSDIQMTSASTGISHSEKAHGPNQVHFLQIWAFPSQSRLQPEYYTRHFSDSRKKNQWARVVASIETPGVTSDRDAADGPAPIHSALTMYATILERGRSLEQALQGKKAYVHVIQTSGYREGKASGASIKASSQGAEVLMLGEGDGAYIFVGIGGNILQVMNDGDRSAELVLFDLQ